LLSVLHISLELSSKAFSVSTLGIKDIEDVLRASRMRWLSHVECSTGWIARVRERKILAQNAPGRPKLTWDELVKRGRVLLGMERTDPEDRQAWRGRL